MTLLSRDGSATSITPPLSQAGGYVVVVVIGLIFAFSGFSDVLDSNNLLSTYPFQQWS